LQDFVESAMRGREYTASVKTHRIATVALGVLGAWATTERSASAQTVQIAVNGAGPVAPFKHVWSYYGFDEVNYTTTPEGRDLLQALVRAHDERVYIRSHFLLNTNAGAPGLKWGSTNVYTEDTVGNPIYDFSTMDLIMDTVTGIGALPLVEIAFMPQALSTRPNPYRNSSVTALDGGSFYPPTDYQKWQSLIREWALHTRDRYPEADAWLWQLWNEPDIGYWKGTPAEFDRLYDFTEAAVHEVFPSSPLGGPETASAGAFLTQFLTHCATGVNAVTGAIGTRLDLVTFHAKGGVAIVNGNVRMNLGNQLRLHQNGFNIVAGFPQYRQTPIIIGEADPDGCAACSTADVPANAYRNSTAYGAYEMAMMKRSLELEARTGVNLRALLTWAFTFVPEPWFSGFRELANNGIHKPVLNAFKLLGRLAGDRLPLTSTGARDLDDVLANSVRALPDVDAMATLAPDGKVQVLVWNYHDDLLPVAPTPVHLEVALPAAFGSRGTLTHYRVDETHGDAYTVWVAQGSPAAPSEQQVAAMREAMEPSLLEPPAEVDVIDGTLSLDFDLPRFGLSLVTLEPERALPVDAGAPNGSESPPAGLEPNIPVDNPADDATGSTGTGDELGADTPVSLTPGAVDPNGMPTTGTVEALAGAADEGCACRSSAQSTTGAGASALFAVLVGFALRRRRAF
jgi:xylan 1,4-beta-xylosidase